MPNPMNNGNAIFCKIAVIKMFILVLILVNISRNVYLPGTKIPCSLQAELAIQQI